MNLRTFLYAVCAALIVPLGVPAATSEPMTERVSVDSAGGQTNNASGEGDSISPAVSADGRFVAFVSGASNLVAGDTNFVFDVFVRDRQTGTTERVNADSAAGQAHAILPAVSGDGRFVAFVSVLPALFSTARVFVYDRATGQTEPMNSFDTGTTANSISPAISADGRFVAFASVSNVVVGDTNNAFDVFVRDRQTGTTERVSEDSAGGQANFGSISPAISADGRFVAFASLASNLVAGDTNNDFDVFVRDRQTGATERVSVDSAGGQANGGSGFQIPGFVGRNVAITADGRFVAFASLASNLVAGDTNGTIDVFVHDRATGQTERVSVDSTGAEGDFVSFSPAVSAEGRFVAFASAASNLVAGDTNGVSDVFVRDRGADTVRFAAFAAKVEVEELNELAVKTTFQLGAASNGIDPTREDVTLRLGALEVTIAAGAFRVDEKARFRFKGVVNGLSVDAQIQSLKTGGFEFKAELPGAAAASIGMRVEVSLTVGDDTGTTVAAVERGKH